MFECSVTTGGRVNDDNLDSSFHRFVNNRVIHLGLETICRLFTSAEFLVVMTLLATFFANRLMTVSNASFSKKSRISETGLQLIKDFEGCRLKAYQCKAGKWTIGYGHTGGVKSGDQISYAQANKLLVQDVAWAENSVNQLVKVSLSQDQFDALCSFVFNVGRGAFASSTMLKKLNAGDYDGAADEFLRWNRAGFKILEGLKRRRAKERELFKRSCARQYLHRLRR